MSILQIRLKNCIQTILELEPTMRAQGETGFDREFSFLKNYLERVEDLELVEEDVQKLENETSVFLAELERSLYWSKNFLTPMQ